MRTKLVILLFVIVGVSAVYFFGRSLLVHADTNISATTNEHFAWNPAIGWVDFYTPMTLNVKNTKIEGYASSSFGEISFDCATTPSGNICAQSNYGVCNGTDATRNSDGSCPNADASGDLSGFAWNDKIGWISMRGSSPSYGVSIASNGIFSGYAWNDAVGWISFNSSNPNHSSSTDYKVVTTWIRTTSIGYLESSIYDTQKTGGVLLNNIVWRGTKAGGTGECVDFQIAASNSPSGPWVYKGPNSQLGDYYGASCTTGANGGIGCANPGEPICIKKTDFSNYRYFRYKVRVQTNFSQKSPEINDIILNWSP
jgi:hypothetical protein